ncbi:MAG: GAF domain-containing sensor histidine kinase [Acidimicrobiia bacterium]|nr:GAF domain-containing sensor histidine kinase [Acidimicrobiia bacterium]
MVLPVVVLMLVALAPDTTTWPDGHGRASVVGVLLAITLLVAVYGLGRAAHLHRLLGLLAVEEERSLALFRDVGRSAALLRAAGIVNSVAEPQEVLEEILDAALTLFRCEDGAILETDGNDTEMVAARGRLAERPVSREAETSIVDHVLRSRRPALGSFVVAEKPLSDRTQAASAMAAPLLHRGELLGVLALQAPPGAHFEDSEIVTMSVFADHAAMATAHARLRVLETEQIAALLEADRLRRELMIVSGHELRTPVTVMRSAAAGAARPDLDAESRNQLLELIDQQAVRFEQMSSAVVDECRRVGGVRVPLRAVDLTSLVSRYVRDAAASGRPVEFAEVAPCRITGSEEALTRMMDALLENARVHGEPPVRFSIERDVVHAVLTVSDSGPGVRPEDRQRIFDPGFGSGRGLTIVRGLAQACRATVWVEDSPAGGAAFRVAFRRIGSTASGEEGTLRTTGAFRAPGPVADVGETVVPDTAPPPDRAGIRS